MIETVFRRPNPQVWSHPEMWQSARTTSLHALSQLSLDAAIAFEQIMDPADALPKIGLSVYEDRDHLKDGWASYVMHDPDGNPIGHCHPSWNADTTNTMFIAEIYLAKDWMGDPFLDSHNEPMKLEDLRGKKYGLATYVRIISQALRQDYHFQSYRAGLSKYGNRIWSILETAGVAKKTYSTDEVNESERAGHIYTRNQYEILSPEELIGLLP